MDARLPSTEHGVSRPDSAMDPGMENSQQLGKKHTPNTTMQVFKIATVSSVQILVLVIAGTSGFIISLLGLIIPNSFKSRSPSTDSRPRRAMSPAARRARAASPSSLSLPSSIGAAGKKKTVQSGRSSSTSRRIAPAAVDALERDVQAHPMSRGNSSTSKASTVPELGISNSSTTSSSCSSSISEHHNHHSQLHSNVHHHHHHGISANALYEGIVNRCKAKKNNSNNKKESNAMPLEEKASNTNNAVAVSRRTSLSATSSPRNSHEGVRARLSSLIMPHSHSSAHFSNNNKTHSIHSGLGSGQSSPVISPEGPSRTSTMPDVISSNTDMNEEEMHVHVTEEAKNANHTTQINSRPPFLTRIFTFSSASSSSSSSSAPLSSSTIPSSSSSLASSSTSPLDSSLPTSKLPFPSSSFSSGIPLDSNIAIASSEVRPKARRLSTRLVSLRSTAGNNNSKASRRALSESEGHQQSSISQPVFVPSSTEEGGPQEEMQSPPQTPRLGSLPPSTSSFTPGSNGPYSPLRSPLARRSFFASSPSKKQTPTSTFSSPVNSMNITPQALLGKGSPPPISENNNTTINAKMQLKRPTLGVRSASNTHTSSSSSSSWKGWMSGSPSKTISATKTTKTERSRSISTSISAFASYNKAQAQSTGVVPSGAGRHARHVSDSVHLQTVQEGSTSRVGRALPLAVASSSAASPSSTSTTGRPRQALSYRALSYAPPSSHTSANLQTKQQHLQSQQSQQQQQQLQQQKSFVPFHPFLDENYGKLTLDLSGTSALSMSVHFGDVGGSTAAAKDGAKEKVSSSD